MEDNKEIAPVRRTNLNDFITDFKNIRFKKYTLSIAASGGRYTVNTPNLDKDINKVIAIALNANIEAQAWNRQTIEFLLNGKEVLPEGFPAKFLMAGFDCAVADRWFVIDREAGTGKVDIRITDNAHSTAFAANTVELLLVCEYDEGVL